MPRRDVFSSLRQAESSSGTPPEPTQKADTRPSFATPAKQPLDLIAREFGGELGDALADAPLGQWIGPVRSGFGMHLVRVSERIPGYLPSLAQARRAVSREWESDRRKAALESNYADLRKAYRIVIESPDAVAPVK